MLNVNLRIAKEAVMKLVPLGRPIVAMGSPGIGKTEIMKQAAKALFMGCKVTEASSLDPTDTRGIPYVTDGESKYGRPSILPDVKKDGEKGLLVIDELASCLPAVQVSLYPLFLERRLGDYPLPKGWVPMGTGNYTSDGAIAYSLSSALTDRVFILNITPDFQVWKEDFAFANGINADIISFLNWRPELFYTFDKRDKTAKGKAFASPRSYELASNALKTNLGDDILMAVLAGCLGEGVAVEFVAFRKVSQGLPDIKKIYMGKHNAVPDNDKPDVLYALTGALVGFLSRLPEELPKAMAVERFFEYSMKLPAEFTVLGVKDALSLHKQDIVKSKNWGTFSKKYRELVL